MAGYNYFAKVIHPDHGLIIKIGFSEVPEWRVSTIRHWGLRPELIVAVPGAKGTEAAMHEMLTNYRVAKEWFRPGRLLHRVLIQAAGAGCLPPAVWEAGQAIDRFAAAKRDMKAKITSAGRWFGDGEESGKVWTDAVFRIGKKSPDKLDDSWIPTPDCKTYVNRPDNAPLSA